MPLRKINPVIALLQKIKAGTLPIFALDGHINSSNTERAKMYKDALNGRFRGGVNTPLTFAIDCGGGVEMVKALLSLGADPNMKTQLPLSKAELRLERQNNASDQDTQEEEESTDTTDPSSDGDAGRDMRPEPVAKTPFEVALAAEDIEIVEALVQHPDFQCPPLLKIWDTLLGLYTDAPFQLGLLKLFPGLSVSMSSSLKEVLMPNSDEDEESDNNNDNNSGDDDDKKKVKRTTFGQICTLDDFRKFYKPTFGKSNPERRGRGDVFVQEMMRRMCGAYTAGSFFAEQLNSSNQESENLNPVWCFDRFGTSVIHLPGNRLLAIAGEHEDSYDPDFNIYNDVFLFQIPPSKTAKNSTNNDNQDHDAATPKQEERPVYQMFCYPREVFPPTDFHTATLVPEESAVYIVGNLGYVADRRPAGPTPIYRLDLSTMAIAKVEPDEKLDPEKELVPQVHQPGWVSSHICWYDATKQSLVVQGGRVVHTVEKELEDLDPTKKFLFHLPSRRWFVEKA